MIEPDRGGDSADNLLFVPQGRKIDEEDTVGEIRRRGVPARDRDRGLAYPAGPQHGNQPLRLQPRSNLVNRVVATDHAAERGRKVGRPGKRASPVLFCRLPVNRRDKAIAASLYIRDVSIAELS